MLTIETCCVVREALDADVQATKTGGNKCLPGELLLDESSAEMFPAIITAWGRQEADESTSVCVKSEAMRAPDSDKDWSRIGSETYRHSLLDSTQSKYSPTERCLGGTNDGGRNVFPDVEDSVGAYGAYDSSDDQRYPSWTPEVAPATQSPRASLPVAYPKGTATRESIGIPRGSAGIQADPRAVESPAFGKRKRAEIGEDSLRRSSAAGCLITQINRSTTSVSHSAVESTIGVRISSVEDTATVERKSVIVQSALGRRNPPDLASAKGPESDRWSSFTANLLSEERIVDVSDDW